MRLALPPPLTIRAAALALALLTLALLTTALAAPAHAQATLEITERWVSGGNAGSKTGTGGITVDEGEEVEFTINGTLPLGATGGLWVRISCGGGTNCYDFLNTWPRIGADNAPSDPNFIHEIPTTESWAWKTKDVEGTQKQTIAFPFLVTTQDDNCKKRGAARYIQVNIQVTQSGGGSQSGSVRITITDDDADATDPLYGLTFLKPECGATFGS